MLGTRLEAIRGSSGKGHTIRASWGVTGHLDMAVLSVPSPFPWPWPCPSPEDGEVMLEAPASPWELVNFGQRLAGNQLQRAWKQSSRGADPGWALRRWAGACHPLTTRAPQEWSQRHAVIHVLSLHPGCQVREGRKESRGAGRTGQDEDKDHSLHPLSVPPASLA